MSIWLSALIFLLGVALVVKGGDMFVDAASWMAKALGIPTFVVGATIVSIATTMPELLVSMFAAAEGKTEMAIGNAVGSVIANTGLILGTALVFMVNVIRRRDYIVQISLLIGSAVVLWLGCLSGYLSIWSALILMAIFLCFMTINVLNAKRQRTDEERPNMTRRAMTKHGTGFVLGATGIVLGSQLLVSSGTDIAAFFGVPERIIAVTLVAVGTSLPEFVTTITAIAKKQSSLSLGNIIGANTINFTMILPLSALVSGQALPVSQQSAMFDIPAAIAFVAIAFIPVLIFKRTAKIQGALLIAMYGVYLGITVF